MTRPLMMLCLAGVLALGGCAQTKVPGRVIEGDVSFIGTVDDKDPRLSGPGIPGVTVSARSEGGPATGMTLGSVTSGKSGGFELPIREEKAALYSVGFRAAGPGYIEAQQTMPLPPKGRQLLVILRRAPGGAGGR